jgi:hypothetical protein
LATSPTFLQWTVLSKIGSATLRSSARGGRRLAQTPPSRYVSTVTAKREQSLQPEFGWITGNLCDPTFLSSSLTCPATQSGLCGGHVRVESRGQESGDFLFTGKHDDGQCITTRQSPWSRSTSSPPLFQAATECVQEVWACCRVRDFWAWEGVEMVRFLQPACFQGLARSTRPRD